MPRVKRSPEAIDATKQDILKEALALMTRHGFDGFSMRKLGDRLGVSAKTIYNYYKNKDELYLAILTEGFQQLYDRFIRVYSSIDDPFKRMEALGREYLTFGLEHANIYNLMFTWHVPKFKDYVGTPMEPAAKIELETALGVSELFMQAIRAAANGSAMPDKDARFHMIQVWSQMHGFVAGFNNTLLDYMHENPKILKEQLLERVMTHFKRDVQHQGGSKYLNETHSPDS
ncbi:MAG: TetR/AcrR family transcriptional regulator [Desulfosalsimonadaceae bacterium]